MYQTNETTEFRTKKKCNGTEWLEILAPHKFKLQTNIHITSFLLTTQDIASHAWSSEVAVLTDFVGSQLLSEKGGAPVATEYKSVMTSQLGAATGTRWVVSRCWINPMRICKEGEKRNTSHDFVQTNPDRPEVWKGKSTYCSYLTPQFAWPFDCIGDQRGLRHSRRSIRLLGYKS